MHVETLKVFCDVVETRSFSTAASQNFVTQSAVSQQVRMLEERYGRRLLERTRGNVQATPSGEVLYHMAKEIVRLYDDMEAKLREAAEMVAGAVRVVAVPSIGLYELAGPLRAFLTKFPQVHLRLEYGRASRIYEDAQKGNIDFGIVAYPQRRPGITVIPFRQDRLVIVVPPGHPLARHKSANLGKLQGEALVGFERDIPTRKETDRLLRRHDVDPRYVTELDNIETIKRMVEIGHGIALLPEPAVVPEVKSRTLAIVQIADEAAVRPLGIIHRQGRVFSPAAQQFLECLRAQ